MMGAVTSRRLWTHEASAVHLVDGPALAELAELGTTSARHYATPRRSSLDAANLGAPDSAVA